MKTHIVFSDNINPEKLAALKEQETLLRQYAAGEITWTSLRGCGIENYREVLAGLGNLGLRPPVAPMEGPNVEARRRGRATVRQSLLEHAPPT